MAKKEAVLFEINLEGNGGRFTFRELDEVSIWLAEEISFWSWMSNLASLDGNLSQTWSTIVDPLSVAQRLVQDCRNQIGQPSYASSIAGLQSHLLNTYASGKALHSKSPRAKLVASLRKSGDQVAAYALCYFLGLAVGPLKSVAFTGITDAILYERGLQKTSDAERQALQELRQEWTNHLSQYRAEEDELQNRFELVSEEIKSAKNVAEKAFAELISSNRVAFETQLKGSATELAAIAKTYDQKLALQAPVKYWEKKRKVHQRLMLFLAFLLIAYFCSGSLIFYSYLHDLLSELKPGTALDHWRISGIILGATVYLWVARILVRLFMSQTHLEADASERVTMVQTYLSLMRKGVGPKDGDIQFVLQALFRQASDGIVKDDTAPSAVFEQLTRGSGKS